MNDEETALSSQEALSSEQALSSEGAATVCERVRETVRSAVVTDERFLETVLTGILAEGHVLLEDVPGTGKTLTARSLATALGLEFNRIQFTPDLLPADVTGSHVYDESDGSFEFREGPIFANVVLADEINRAPPKTQAALLEAMQEYHVTSMGKSYPLTRPFQVVATQNPIEQEGTYPLPEAQLDRFMFSLWMEYPAEQDEVDIVLKTTAPQSGNVQPLLTPERIAALQDLVRRMPVSRHVASYAVFVARATRPGAEGGSDLARRYIEWGAGTRAAQYMTLGAKALAALEGEPTPSCAHVRAVALPVLRHRVLPNYLASGEGLSAADLVLQVLESIPIPQS